MPQLFAKMSGGLLFTAIFFFALFIASISSLISMLELGVRLLMDYQIERKLSVLIVIAITFLAGIPSALNLKIFNNQDWVWGVGLLISGFFFIFFVLKYGIVRFRKEMLDYPVENIILNNRTIISLFLVMVIEFTLMFIWWFSESVSWYPQTWWNPFDEFTIGTCIMQWGVLLLFGIIFNNKLAFVNSNYFE